MATNLLEQLRTSLGSEYVFDRELGGGGMSRVFLAEERRLGRRVVVKVVRPEPGAALSTDRFEREIRLAALLQDPRIVQLLQAGHVGDLPFYTMPYVEGESLRVRLGRSPVPLDEALRILRDIVLALEYAHGRQVIHRDIKPENILLSGRTAVVADFGIAKAITAATEAGAGSTLTELGAIVGTPAYMAPEQAAGDPVDARTDLYAWGLIAYEMLAGAHPFAGHTTAQALWAAHIAETPEPLADHRPDLPAALTALVDRCLAKDAAARPGDAAAVLAELDRIAAPPVARAFRPARLVALAAIAALVIGVVAVWLYHRSQDQAWARTDALPAATRLETAERPLAAYLLLTKAARAVPSDTDVTHALAAAIESVSVTSEPPGARVSIQDYGTPDSAWYVLGRTPLTKVRIPKGDFRWKVESPGHTAYLAAPLTRRTMAFPLDAAARAPEGMVPVPARIWQDYVDFVGWVGPDTLPAYFIDRFEVTNRAYQRFVDAGGYESPRFWTERFVRNGRALTWNEAMTLFRDRTGRAGPSTWAGGHYPDGKADYPVSGVSWYEASAYAAFAGKSLPSLAQWYEAAPDLSARYVVPASNISRDSLAPVGAFKGLGPYGTYDMAGNVREWTRNALTTGERFVLGGSWHAQTYQYTDPETLSPFDRAPENGIRCVRNLAPLPVAATAPVTRFVRDFSKVRPVNDAVFSAYRVMYAYDKTPLNAKDEGVVQDTPDWRIEKVTVDAAYNNERFAIFLFLPKRVRPPYQTMVFFPSARVLLIQDSKTLGDTSFFDYVVQSGRAVAYPIYQDTYERRLLHQMPGQTEDRTLITERYQDFARTLDYLDTRPDIDSSKFAYMGVSMGSAEGVIYATLAQARLKAVIFLDGGFFLNIPPAGADQADFAPRLTRPVLMVNGKYDFTFAPETSQLPLFRMLGTPTSEKLRVEMNTPHDVRQDRPLLVRSVLGWLDKYLGRVQ